MLYEALSVRPTEKLELFSTSFSNYPSGFSCWYIVFVKGILTEEIISACMNNFTTAPFHHFGISPFHHSDVLPFHHSKHTILFVAYSCFQYHWPHVKVLIIYFIFVLRIEPLLIFGPSLLLKIIDRPLISTILKKALAKCHTSDHLVPCMKQNIFSFPT